MPEITQTNSNGESSLGFLNVSSTVGKNSVNHVGDVFLVQVLFYEILPYVYGMDSADIPYPTGTYDRQTEGLILKYQEMSSRSRKVKIWKDGFINRAVGAHVPGKKRVWTITYMNEDVYYVHESLGYEGDYISYLTYKYPALEYYLSSYA
jgi:hypothetical protein